MKEELKYQLVIDKTNWTQVKFGDVVFEPKETIKDATADIVEHVVGLEHINPENIRLNRSASFEKSTTFTKRFSVDDVLFGRRRAYLKKAAQASFTGICSGDITVMRSTESLIPELLPFIVNNDKFFDYAVKYSAGGLSPRVKFKDLANYEFLLPPKEEQNKLAELLWTMDEVIESDTHIYEKTKTLIKSIQLNIFKNFNKIKLQDEYSLLAGYAFKSKDFSSKGIPVVKIKDIKEINNSVDTDSISDFIPSNDKYEKYLIKHGDLLVGLTGAKSGAGYVGKLGEIVDNDREFLLNQRVARLTSRFNNSNPLTKLLVTSSYFLNDVWKRCNEGAQANISTEDLYKCMIPDLTKEKRYYNELSFKIYESLDLIEKKLKLSRDLQKSLINQIF